MTLRRELKTQGDFLFKHRSYLPVGIIILGLAAYFSALLDYDPSSFWYQWPYEVSCFLTCCLGLFIRSYAIGYSADNTSGRNTKVGQVADSINTTGLYSQLRHPLYLGNFLMWLGVAGFTRNPWFLFAFVFIFWVYYERIMYAEETFLEGEYGERYTNWAANLPAFVPKFKNWVSPNLNFSWRKIIRQEKAGIVNMFLVINFFEFLGQRFVAPQAFDYQGMWKLGLLCSIVWYVVVKLIQKTTTMLNVDRAT